MKFLSTIFASLLLGVFSVSAHSNYGCVSDDTGLIYPNYVYGSTYEPINPQTPGVGDYCSPRYEGSCRIRSRSDCRGCGPRVNEGTRNNPDYWYYQPGKEYSYMACPIDKDIPLILLLTSGVGFLIVRKKAIKPAA